MITTKIFQSINTFCFVVYFIVENTLSTNHRHFTYAKLLFMMTIMMTCVYDTRATEVTVPHQSQRLAYNENNSWNIGEQLLNVRHWMKSLASEWNSSESDTHGKFTV